MDQPASSPSLGHSCRSLTHSDTSKNAFSRACAFEEISEHFPKVVELNGVTLLLIKKGEEVFALNERCPHKDLSMQHGVVMNGTIICPHHRYAFDLETGACKNRRRCDYVETYETMMEDGIVYVRVP